jgi:hypothetical protein
MCTLFTWDVMYCSSGTKLGFRNSFKASPCSKAFTQNISEVTMGGAAASVHTDSKYAQCAQNAPAQFTDGVCEKPSRNRSGEYF